MPGPLLGKMVIDEFPAQPDSIIVYLHYHSPHTVVTDMADLHYALQNATGEQLALQLHRVANLLLASGENQKSLRTEVFDQAMMPVVP